jgi:hypothetical protein
MSQCGCVILVVIVSINDWQWYILFVWNKIVPYVEIPLHQLDVGLVIWTQPKLNMVLIDLKTLC